VRVLVDSQLPAALTRFLAAQGVECQHVHDVGLAQSSDSEVWQFAAERQMVIISKDEDFFHLTARSGSALQLIWVRLGNCRTRALLAAFEAAWPRVRACIESGERVVELR